MRRFTPGPKPLDLVERLGLQGTTSPADCLASIGRRRLQGARHRAARAQTNSPSVPDLVYVIAGDGDDRPRLERLAEQLEWRTRPDSVGTVADDDLPALYRAADLFVMPSAGEGFGIVFLEAMASGLPVIGGSTDGSRDPLRDGLYGCMVEPGDDTELANAIAESLAAGREGKARSIRLRPHRIQPDGRRGSSASST